MSNPDGPSKVVTPQAASSHHHSDILPPVLTPGAALFANESNERPVIKPYPGTPTITVDTDDAFPDGNPPYLNESESMPFRPRRRTLSSWDEKMLPHHSITEDGRRKPRHVEFRLEHELSLGSSASGQSTTSSPAPSQDDTVTSFEDSQAGHDDLLWPRYLASADGHNIEESDASLIVRISYLVTAPTHLGRD